MSALGLETLTPRERVRRAIRREPVDRMPIDLGCHFSTGISAFAYDNLRRYLGMDTSSIEVIDPGQFLARVDADIRARFHVDTIVLHPGFPATRRWNPRGDHVFTVPDAFRPELQPDGAYHIYRPDRPARRAVMPRSGFFFDGDGGVDYWQLDRDDWWARYAREAHRIRHETDLFTMFMGFPGYFGDMDECCEMYTDPDAVCKRNEERLANALTRFQAMRTHCGDTIDSIEVNSDLGTQSGPYVSPEVYERCTYPYLKAFCHTVHESSDVLVFMHCCGSMQAFLPYLIDAGVDVINPVQISARDMDPAVLKATYGGQIAFWGGGVDTQHVLGQGTPAEVSAQVAGLIDIFAPGSGYVFNQVHNVMGNVPPENIVAMLDTAYACSFRHSGLQPA